MIYLQAYTLTLNYLLMIHHYFELLKTLLKTSKLNNDLIRIQEWGYQWKMCFNPDRTKPAHKVVVSRKTKNIIYPNLHFNNVPIVKTTSENHLGLNIDATLTSNDHINDKAMKNVGLLRKLQCFYHAQVC